MREGRAGEERKEGEIGGHGREGGGGGGGGDYACKLYIGSGGSVVELNLWWMRPLYLVDLNLTVIRFARDAIARGCWCSELCWTHAAL